MTSLEEAFAPITLNIPGMGAGTGSRSYNSHGFDPMGSGQQAWHPSSHMPDELGYPMTQSDDRRQYAQAANSLEHQRWNDNWGQPNPAQFTRGVHSNLSRENRMGEPRQHNLPAGAGTVKMQSQADYPPRSSPGTPYPQYPHNADYMPSYINPLDGSGSPGAPVSSVGDAPRAAAAKSRLKDTFGSVSRSRSNESTVGPVPNPSDYRNMHPTQWDSNISGAPVQARQFTPGYGPSANASSPNANQYNSDMSSGQNISEMMMDAPTPSNISDVKRLQEQIRQLTAKLDRLEKKVGKVENSRSHDIILIVVLAVFLLFIVDNIFGFNKLT